MNSASRPIPLALEPLVPRSLGTLAAALVTCTHPEGRRVRAALDLGPGEIGIYWCAACGALCTQDAAAPWQVPSLASAFSRKAFEDLVLLLHAVVQLAQLARAHAPAGSAGSPAHIFLRNVRASLSELSRLPVVRDVDRLEEALAQMPKSPVRPSR
jgi:pimeloyl-ACP methyl ester carboxylesterase